MNLPDEPDESDAPEPTGAPLPPDTSTLEGESGDPLYTYVAKMNYPGRYQKTWTIRHYSDEEAADFVRAGVAPGGMWYGWTVAKFLRVNYPEPNTILPIP